MKLVNKLKRATPVRRTTHKTKDDFLRWLKKQKALKMQTPEEKTLNPPEPSRRHNGLS